MQLFILPETDDDYIFYVLIHCSVLLYAIDIYALFFIERSMLTLKQYGMVSSPNASPNNIKGA